MNGKKKIEYNKIHNNHNNLNKMKKKRNLLVKSYYLEKKNKYKYKIKQIKLN